MLVVRRNVAEVTEKSSAHTPEEDFRDGRDEFDGPRINATMGVLLRSPAPYTCILRVSIIYLSTDT